MGYAIVTPAFTINNYDFDSCLVDRNLHGNIRL